jgi:ABC-type oligopeptide transport system ATPase subunit
VFGATGREALLEVRDLRKTFSSRGLLAGRQRASTAAVDGVSFRVRRGTTLGIVGESGSGKSTTARLIGRLIEPTSGTVTLDGEDLTQLRGDDLRRVRRHVQIVFQDALGSLDPRRRVGSAIREPLHAFGEPATKARVTESLELVGLSAQHAERAPHELSGGQRQRVAIARALALRPKMLICDEPVASLDVSIQAQVINLLRQLQAELGLAYIFISHDLSLVRHVSDETVVMLSGRIVEAGPTEQLWSDPQHAYTQTLLAAIPGRAASGRALAV